MRRFDRDGDLITATMEPAEVELLGSLVDQLLAMLRDSDPRDEPADEDGAGEDDPFALWARDLAADPDEPEVPDDPALQRLFPNAYPHDPEASSDFRRFTQGDMWQSKIAAAETVHQALAATDAGTRPVQIGPDQVDAWLKCLTNLRLVLAARLGISDMESAERAAAVSDDDPRAFMISVYEWLGFAQETLVDAL